MAEYLSDVEESDYEDFEYDGTTYRLEPEYTDEELHERRMRRQRRTAGLGTRNRSTSSTKRELRNITLF